MELRFRVQGFGFRVSGLGFRVGRARCLSSDWTSSRVVPLPSALPTCKVTGRLTEPSLAARRGPKKEDDHGEVDPFVLRCGRHLHDAERLGARWHPGERFVDKDVECSSVPQGIISPFLHAFAGGALASPTRSDWQQLVWCFVSTGKRIWSSPFGQVHVSHGHRTGPGLRPLRPPNVSA